MRAASRAATAVAAILGWAANIGATPPPAMTAAHSDYILACGGCHGISGTSNSVVVPQLAGLVGYYLKVPAGRDYLPRLPNIAFASLSDRRLADLLNYMVFEIGHGSAPVGAEPYTESEVARLRKRPLTDVSLSAYRQRLVDVLMRRYGAPSALGAYGDTATTTHQALP